MSARLGAAVEASLAIGAARSFAEVCETALDHVLGVLQADRAALLLHDARGTMRFVAWRGLSDGYRAAVEGHSPWAADDPAPAPVLVPDVEADTLLGPVRRVVLAEGIRALACVPLAAEGRLLGKFMVYFDRPHAFVPGDIDIARLLASLIGFGMARFRASEEAQQARGELEAVLETVSDGITVQGPDGALRYVNGAAARLMGFADPRAVPEAPRGFTQERWDLIREDGTPMPYEELPSTVALGGTAAEGLVGFRPRAGGETRWSMLRSRPCHDAEGRFRFAVNVFHDVTRTRREAEERRFLLEAGALLSTSLELEVTLASLARLVVPRLADGVAIDVLDEQGARHPVVLHHADPAKIAPTRRLMLEYPVEGTGGINHVLRTGEPSLVSEIPPEALAAAARDEEHLRLLREVAPVSAMTVPLKSRGRVLGALSLASCARRFDADDLAFATRLADRAARAVDNARVYAESRSNAARLERALEAQKAAERELRAERERLAVTLASIGDAVIATDTRGVVTLLNAVAEALTGWCAAEAVGRPLSEVFPIFAEDTGLRADDPVRAVLRTGRMVGMANHTVLEARDGARRAIEDSAAPIRDAQGACLGVALVFRDVTAARRLEAEMARAGKLESLGVLAGGVAHDFNNLLTGILANLSLARRELPADLRVHQRVADAERAAVRARDLTQQLLTFSKGGAPIRKPASLADIVVESAAFVLSGANVLARTEVQPGLWPVEVDAGQISQVVQNIVINALQAMPDGGAVDITLANVGITGDSGLPLPPGPYVRLEITDHGAGIPPEHLGRIFDPFFTTKQKGSGLGLATSYSVVRNHEGHIGVDSRPGAGARFVVHLPARPEATAVPGEPHAPSLPSGTGRILVMDDEPIIRDAARGLLEALGYEVDEVDEVDDGDAALAAWSDARARGSPYDALILDLTVPGGKGGKQVIEEIRAVDPDARAIVSSGYSEDPVMADCRRYGFRDVVAKPYTVEELARVVTRVLGSPGG